MEYAILYVEDYQSKRLKVTQSAQEREVCVLCFGVSDNELQPVATSPFVQESNNFNFIEVQIGYTLPERICAKCLTDLNHVACFIKMCQNSFSMYTQIEENQKINNQPAFVNQHITFEPSCETNEDNEQDMDKSETNEDNEQIDADKSETKADNEQIDIDEDHSTPESIKSEVNEFQELLNELAVEMKVEVEGELNIFGALRDHLYHKENKKKKNGKAQIKMKACPTCNENVPLLTSHYRDQPRCRPKNAQCPMCWRRFKDVNKLRRHQEAHHPDKVTVTLSMCHICSKTFKYSTNLKRHLRVHKHGKRFTCEQCGNGYTTAAHLRSHQNIHLNLKPYLCEDCGKQFYRRSDLYIHDRHVHRKTNSKAPRSYKSKKKGVEEREVTENELVACNICDRHFTEFGLKIHMHTHNENRTCYCSKCKTEFETGLSYRQHLKIHARKDAECPHCFKKYSRNTIKQHINTHIGDRPFSCPECGKTFRTRVHLGSHRLAVHNVNRGTPLRCQYCDQSFTFRGNLRVHERIHTGETPYPCHVCDEAFADTKKRKKHVAQAHGEDEVENIVSK